MPGNLYYYLGFSYFLGIGPLKFQLLQNNFSNLKLAYEANELQLAKIIGSKTAAKFVDFRRRFYPEKELEIIRKKGTQIITREDKFFPQPLLQISDPPICLYIKGEIKKYNFEKELLIGVVGTRQPTTYGQQITRRFVKDLAEQKIVIVSGLALGIDALAHETALEVKGRTIAILGCGVDIVYPAANRWLYQKILKEKGLIISEFPPLMPVARGLFISRNRLISGLSQGILVVEGSEKSGTLITARYAAEQGKDVFAVPAPIDSTMSQAPNLLLKQGAKLVVNVNDILEEYGLKKLDQQIREITENFKPDEKAVYDQLRKKELTANELMSELHLDLTTILNILSNLELLGIVGKDVQGKYCLK